MKKSDPHGCLRLEKREKGQGSLIRRLENEQKENCWACRKKQAHAFTYIAKS
jgi:stalled ribosome alternative rescue factor ArfA